VEKHGSLYIAWMDVFIEDESIDKNETFIDSQAIFSSRPAT
jgi:hypothetical protein